MLPVNRILTVGAGLAVLSVAPWAARLSPLDYPQWRGQSRDGSASAFVAPEQWPTALTRRWTVEIGEGYATPLVIGDVVYVFSRENATEVMTALDARTGDIVWRSGYPAPYKPGAPASAHGSGPKATPLFYEARLYTLGIRGLVSAFDAHNGEILWQTEPPRDQPFYGTAVSPLAEASLVITHPGNYGPLTAFDASTGAVKWTAGDGGTFASPIVVELHGIRQVITVTQTSIVGVSPRDGAVLWRHPWKAAATPGAITPVKYADTIIVSGQGMGVTALRPVRPNGRWDVEVAWETKDVSMFLSNPVIVGDTLFGLSERSSGQYFALDAKSGQVLWLGPPREAENSAIGKAGQLLFLLNDDGELIIAAPSRSGFEPLRRYAVADTPTWAQPAISGNRVVVKDSRAVTLWTVN